MGSLLIMVGGLVSLIAWIWLLVVIFQDSIVWGVCSLVIPIVGLVFVITHWDTAKKPFLYQLAGFAITVLGVVLSPQHAHGIGV